MSVAVETNKSADDASVVVNVTKNAVALLPPLNFSRVSSDGIFRSAYPSPKTIPFIDTLQLRSMICLTPGDVRQELLDYTSQRNIELLKCPVRHNQEPFLVMSEESISKIVKYVSEKQHRPVLIFCTNGKVRTACVVACLRKVLMNWSMSSIMAEFEQFTEPEGGLNDLYFIESFSYSIPTSSEELQTKNIDTEKDLTEATNDLIEK